MTRVRIEAPAKLNLGLEVIGRRPDGYHEIRSILAMVDLVDTLSVERSCGTEILRSSAVLGIDEADDLALRALKALQSSTQSTAGATLFLHKRIPAAAGLGGASSDAAAALLAGRRGWEIDVSDESLHEIAAGLGTDVPFFLNGPCALVRGTGTEFESLPTLRMWAVIVTPRLRLQRKTARLYGALEAMDFSDGSRIDSAAAAIRADQVPLPETLANAFSRPLLKLEPSLAVLSFSMRQAGAPFVALSGSGGSHYTLIVEEEEARHVARRMQVRLPMNVVVNVVPTSQTGLAIQ